MDIAEQKNHVADLLLHLEKALREQGLWAAQPPSLEQMSSSEPFACDVMSLQAWLQWIFLPRMKVIIESEVELPRGCNISAYAEETLAKLDCETQTLMRLLQAMDKALS